jgi:hypothetical protein
VSYIATNVALEPVQANMKEAKADLEKAKADLEKVKATGLVEFIRKLFSGQQSGSDSQKSARIEEYEQIIQQRSAQIKEYEQTIEKRTDPFRILKEQILKVVDELDPIVDTVLALTQTWATAVINMARDDLLRATITSEDLIYIRGIARNAANSIRTVGNIKNVTKYIKLSFTVGIYHQGVDNAIFVPPGQPIGVHHVQASGTSWSYRYGRGRCMDLDARDPGDVSFRRLIYDFESNESIRNTISTAIATLKEIAPLFPSPVSARPNTQTT